MAGEHLNKSYIPRGDFTVGTAGGVTFGVHSWSAGNTRLHTPFGYHDKAGCAWGKNFKSKQDAIQEATKQYSKAGGAIYAPPNEALQATEPLSTPAEPAEIPYNQRGYLQPASHVAGKDYSAADEDAGAVAVISTSSVPDEVEVMVGSYVDETGERWYIFWTATDQAYISHIPPEVRGEGKYAGIRPDTKSRPRTGIYVQRNADDTSWTSARMCSRDIVQLHVQRDLLPAGVECE